MIQTQAIARHRPRLALDSRLWLLVGLAALIVPTLVSVAQQHWSKEDGAHGPLILATGLWLVWRSRSQVFERARPSHNWGWVLALLPLLLVYAFSRAYNILFVETASLYATLVLLGYCYWGAAAMRLLWFPILYLAFLIVPPGSVVTEATQPLKIWLSGAAAETLYAFGYPVAQTGASLQIEQYQLLVETACAGLGSLLTLSALGLLYVHLRPGSTPRHSIILLAAVVPLAVLANFIRIIIIVLLTYHVSEQVAQGFAHELAGMVMFVVAMLGMLAVDSALRALSARKSTRTA
jgi:exosortase